MRIAVPYGQSRVRNVPSARPKRLFAPSATIVYSARIVDVRAVGPLDVGAAHEAPLDQRVQRLVALQERAPRRRSALAATKPSSSRRRTT